MTKLFILGNGFDINHGLNTKYGDFRNYLKKSDPQLEYRITEIFDEGLLISSYDNLSVDEFDDEKETDDSIESKIMWNHLEESLSFFDIQFFDEKIDYSLLGNSFEEEWKDSAWNDVQYELDKETKVFTEFKSSFIDWIDTIDISSNIRWDEISKDDLFITFNYTDTLELLYDIPQASIFHVHGQTGGEVIIGHATKYSDEFHNLKLDPDGNELLYDPYNKDFRIDELREIISNRTDAFYKPIKEELLPQLMTWLDSKGEPNEVIVFGHSYGKVDWEYFKYLRQRFDDKNWCYGCFSATNEKNLAAMLHYLNDARKIC